MYHTYSDINSRDVRKEEAEENFIDRGAGDGRSGQCSEKSAPPGKKSGLSDIFSNDDLMIILILIFLLNENPEDKTFITVLLIILFMK